VDETVGTEAVVDTTEPAEAAAVATGAAGIARGLGIVTRTT